MLICFEAAYSQIQTAVLFVEQCCSENRVYSKIIDTQQESCYPLEDFHF